MDESNPDAAPPTAPAPPAESPAADQAPTVEPAEELLNDLPFDAEQIEQWERLLEQILQNAPARLLDQVGFSAGAGAVSAILPILIGALILFVGYALLAAIFAFLIWLPYRKVPRQHRRVFGFSIWLTIIPVFGLFWNFRIAGRVPASFRSYFEAHPEAVAAAPTVAGATPHNLVGDAGRGVGLAYAICSLISAALTFSCILSTLAFPFAVAALVLYIIFVARLFGLADRVSEHRRKLKRGELPPPPPPKAIA
ncbi:MAG: hypothetical protein AAF916_09980 [Planctomycetota bacterium]